MSESLERELDSLLKQSQNKSWTKPLPDELSLLISAFLPSQPADLRSKAYLVLSTVCQHVRESTPQSKAQDMDPATESLVKLFSPCISSLFAELGKKDSLVALSFMTALFQVDHHSATSIFCAILDSFVDIIDLSPSDDLSHALARLLAQASAYRPCRGLLSSASQCRRWLEHCARQSDDTVLRSSAAIALIKLSRGYAVDSRDISEGSTNVSSSTVSDQHLVAVMVDLVVHDDSDSITEALEGLAYMSIEPQVKENLSKDASFLTHLFDLVTRLKKSQNLTLSSLSNAPKMYGIAAIISNICAYRPRLSQEQAQIARLRNMTKPQSGTGKDDPLDNDERVKDRCRRMVKSGVVDVLSLLVRVTDSRGVFTYVGKALLSLIEDKENRGRILQGGGSRTLMTIVKAALSSSTSPSSQIDESALEPIQALAKLAITASPVHVFGPDEGISLDAIRPFSLMLTHSSATLLQQFEALMALTNLSSSSPRLASQVATAQGLMNRVEVLLLEDHKLVRRAAMELICNLITGSDEVFNQYGGEPGKGSSRSKLQMLVALSDVEDAATRLAASGALATVSASPNACRALFNLQMDRHRVLPILSQLISSTGDSDEDATVNAGLIHRGVVCVRNFVCLLDESSLGSMVADAQSSGLVAGLVGVIKSNGDSQKMAVLQPAAEALKRLVDAGVSAM